MTRKKETEDWTSDLPDPTPEQLAQLNSLGDLMPEPENLGFSITDLKPTSTSLRRTTRTEKDG